MRLLGVDLIRAIAAFGVIVMHSNFGRGTAMTPAAQAFSDLFIFAVPFFLVTSLYFNASRGRTDFRNLWIRLKRLLVPYLIWSAIYLVAHFGKLFALHRREEIPDLLRSMPMDLLLGATAVHLYFLPLLAVATVMAFFISPVLREWPAWAVILSLGFSCVVAAGTAGLQPTTESLAALKIGGMLLQWCGRGLPIVVAATLVNRWLTREQLNCLPWFIFPLVSLAVFSASLVPGITFPPGTYDVGIGFGWFLLGCALGRWLVPSSWLNALSAAAFGIFLVHHLFVEMIQILFRTASPNLAMVTTLPILMLISSFAFILSFIAAHYVPKWVPSTRVLFMT